MLEEQIIDKYAQYGRISPSRELYLPLDISEKFIKECNKLSIAIIGIELFNIVDENIIPYNPINSIDCSNILQEGLDWKQIVLKCNSLVQKILLLELDRNQYFNPTILEEHERR
jgi:hypothetical protein